ncbi:hypothetical protein PRIPAC_89951 [Pristionchus pacificus]|uniref:glucuronosyltransferase n=1 Tax=Pristionchus pacificus TaxID=54126 RepID=A0A2A6CX21_PRIPA|nr:hypothetical protein PRIPAC_89951 [Pristionchus pacificus]|eukprot:PDM82725.1 glucuronosyltransferase [Pristionchus pacificus]
MVSLTQIFIFLLIKSSLAHKILVFNPTYSFSRVNCITAMVNTLVEAGNEVHVIVPEVANGVKVVGSKAHKTIFVPSLKGNPLNSMLLHKDPLASIDMRDAVHIQNMTIVEDAMCADLIAGYDHWMELKREGGYDVGITESLHAFGIMELLRVKQTMLFVPGARSSAISRLIANLPAPPSITPDPFFSSLALSQHLLSLPQRAFSLAASLATAQLLEMHVDREDSLLRAHWPQLTPLRESLARIALIVENAHPLLAKPEYRTHQIVPIGGLTVDASFGDVDDEITRMLDESTKGVVVIYFSSMGTSMTLSSRLKTILIDSMLALPDIMFLWRIDFDAEEQLPPNLHVFSDSLKSALGHPRVRAVLCDADATTFHEVSFSGVPLIALPLLGDQSYHAAAGIDRGTTVLLDRDTVTADIVTAAIRKVLTDRSLTTNATALAKKLRRWPHRPIDSLVKHVDYVTEYGRPLGLGIPRVPFWVYYCLDVIVPSLIIIVFLVYKIVRLWIGGYYQIYLKMRNNIEKKRELEGHYDETEEEEEEEEPEEPQHHDHHHSHSHSHSHGGHGHSHEQPDCECWRHDQGVIDLVQAMAGQQRRMQHLPDEKVSAEVRKRRKQVSFEDETKKNTK